MPPFDEIERIIDDYATLKQHFRPTSAIMNEFPKMLLMSIVSLYEVRLKQQLSRIVSDVDSGSIVSLPLISLLKNQQRTSDFLYGKFHTYNSSLQCEELNAQPFYDFFGGIVFKNFFKNDFNSKCSTKITALDDEITKLLEIATENPKYEGHWIEKVDERDILAVLNFEEAERSFLSLKLRRNRLAHNYISGLSDTFEDIYLFYQKSNIYVSALFDCLTNIN